MCHLFSSSKHPLGILNVPWPDLCFEASIQCWLLCLEANMLMFTQHNFIPIQSSHPLKLLFHPGLQFHQLTSDPFNSVTCKQKCMKSMTSLFSASRFWMFTYNAYSRKLVHVFNMLTHACNINTKPMSHIFSYSVLWFKNKHNRKEATSSSSANPIQIQGLHILWMLMFHIFAPPDQRQVHDQQTKLWGFLVG